MLRAREVPIVESTLSGALDDAGSCDTYELWRKPGRYRYQVRISGRGAVRLVIEAHQPGGPAEAGAGSWRTIAEASRVGSGPGASGTVTVSEVRLSDYVSADWVQLRVRFSPAAGAVPVGYEFSLRPEP
jgi:hypothetical protein